MKKKRALITGASEGIGREFARQLNKKGYALTLVARNEARLKDLLIELGTAQHQILACDLSTQEGVQSLSRVMNQQHYSLLVNNAGFGLYSDFHETEIKEYERMLELNCTSLMKLSHSFIKQAQTGDALLNVASTLAYLPMAESAVYNATKAFVKSFSETLWYEQKERGVFVLTLCPGITATEFFKRAGGKLDQTFPRFFTQTPEAVVSLALKALEQRKKPVVISGVMNQISVFLTRLLPAKAIITCLGLLSSRKQKRG